MLWINIITSICLAALGLEVLHVILAIFTKKRSQRIEFLRGFKKGKCAVIFLTAIPLYVMGHLHMGDAFFYSIFRSISEVISLVVLQYGTESVEGLMSESGLYEFTIYFTYVLVAVNAIIFTVSVVHQYLWSRRRVWRARMPFSDKLFILGNGEQNISIYNSEKRRVKLLVSDLTDDEQSKLYIQNVAYCDAKCVDYVKTVFKQVGKAAKEVIVVINTGSDDENIEVCRAFTEGFAAMDEAACEKMFLKLRVFVFGDPRYETIYDGIVSEGHGCIQYVNKYKKIATDFIDKYPLTRFMDERHVDYKTSLVKPNVDINVLMIGFGKTNHQIFLTSVANNQFLEAGEGDPVLKKVNYFIFDKEEAENDKNLNHSYYRFKREVGAFRSEDYLPLPSLPAEEHYECLDINSCEFYGKIKEVVTKSPLDANFIIIAFGSDLENIDMAGKLIEKRKEWGLENLTVFVKVRAWHKADSLLSEENCYFIGNEAEEVYDIAKITGDALYRMAMLRNEVYDLEYDITHGYVTPSDEAIKKNHDTSTKKWYRVKSQMERESSIYCCLSLRSKLNLMGLDYVPGKGGMSYEDYIKHYAGEDVPDIKTYSLELDGKPVVNYTLDFPSSRRRNMAVHEHQRWNSFMISRGMIPADKERILNEEAVIGGKLKHTSGKNYAVRRHGNITTFDGLVDFRRMIAARDGKTELECDVIKYDYQLLDDAVWLLDKCGFKIVEKPPVKSDK